MNYHESVDDFDKDSGNDFGDVRNRSNEGNKTVSLAPWMKQTEKLFTA